MTTFFRKYRNQFFLFTIVIFLLGTFLGFGGYFFGPKGGPNESIAEVDGEKIPLRLYYSQYNRALEQLPSDKRLDEATRRQKRDEALRDLVQAVIFNRLAKKYGIEAPDAQVVNSLMQIPAFQTKGAFDPRQYMQFLNYQLKTTPADFEEEQRQAIAFYKLRWLISSAIKVTDSEVELAWVLHGAEFTKANEYVAEEDEKKGKERRRRRAPEEIRKLFREQLWQEKVMWSFNQWFSQIGQASRVKTHLELLEGSPRS